MRDEISGIITDVDDMKDSLRRSQDQLMDMNLNLEKKVADRTEELEAAMNELEAMNENLVRHQQGMEETRTVRKNDMSLAASLQTSFIRQNPAAVRVATTSPSCTGHGSRFRAISSIFTRTAARLRGVGLFDVSGHGISSGLLTLLAKSIISRNFNLHRDEKRSEDHGA